MTDQGSSSSNNEHDRFWELVRVSVHDVGMQGDRTADQLVAVLDLLAATDDPKERLGRWLKDTHHTKSDLAGD
jgi:hypothetical protein